MTTSNGLNQAQLGTRIYSESSHRPASNRSSSVRRKLTSARKVLLTTSSDYGAVDVLLAYVTDRPGRKQINGGYKFQLENSREVT